MENRDSKLIKGTEIIERGWADGYMETFLGAAHGLLEAGGIEASVYCRNCVESFEKTEEFRSAQRMRVDHALRQYTRALQALELAK